MNVFFSHLGADIVGINCHFDPMTCVEAVRLMKEAIEKEGMKVHYMCQPLGYHTPDCGKQGFIDLPEFPFGMLVFCAVVCNCNSVALPSEEKVR